MNSSFRTINLDNFFYWVRFSAVVFVFLYLANQWDKRDARERHRIDIAPICSNCGAKILK